MTPDVIFAHVASLPEPQRHAGLCKVLAKLDAVAEHETDPATLLDWGAGTAAAMGMVVARTEGELRAKLIAEGMPADAPEPYVLFKLDNRGREMAHFLLSERVVFDVARGLLATRLAAAGPVGRA